MTAFLKLYASVLVALFGLHATSAFTTSVPNRVATALHFNVIMPPDDDNCEIDNSNCEESVFARKRAEKKEENEKLRESYIRGGMTVRDIDLVETVDQFSNAAGGGIIPGMQLTALCEDD